MNSHLLALIYLVSMGICFVAGMTSHPAPPPRSLTGSLVLVALASGTWLAVNAL